MSVVRRIEIDAPADETAKRQQEHRDTSHEEHAEQAREYQNFHKVLLASIYDGDYRNGPYNAKRSDDSPAGDYTETAKRRPQSKEVTLTDDDPYYEFVDASRVWPPVHNPH
jgi:hypothetical protein